jgi:hypothetical protein
MSDGKTMIWPHFLCWAYLSKTLLMCEVHREWELDWISVQPFRAQFFGGKRPNVFIFTLISVAVSKHYQLKEKEPSKCRARKVGMCIQFCLGKAWYIAELPNSCWMGPSLSPFPRDVGSIKAMVLPVNLGANYFRISVGGGFPQLKKCRFLAPLYHYDLGYVLMIWDVCLEYISDLSK